jgi:hypothetical protein
MDGTLGDHLRICQFLISGQIIPGMAKKKSSGISEKVRDEKLSIIHQI